MQKVEETVFIERATNEKNKSIIETLEKKLNEAAKDVEKADKRILEVNEKLKTIKRIRRI